MYITPPRAPEAMSVEDLVAHIVGRYQEAHRRTLPELIALAQKVERVHHDVAGAPLGLAEALAHIADELEMHMVEEERVLFRAMRAKADAGLGHPIAVMRGEHRDYAAELDRLQVLAHDFVVPEGACGSWQRLYAGVAELSVMLREQMRLEDEVLFPRFEVSQTRCICAQG